MNRFRQFWRCQINITIDIDANCSNDEIMMQQISKSSKSYILHTDTKQLPENLCKILSCLHNKHGDLEFIS